MPSSTLSDLPPNLFYFFDVCFREDNQAARRKNSLLDVEFHTWDLRLVTDQEDHRCMLKVHLEDIHD